ncbi:MAG: AMP-binding protein [Anaerolineales bacterium]|nr:AMP-binding protein [Anaerolineales bacterium]
MRLHGIADFPELMLRSTQDIAWFTEAVLNYLDIQFYKPYTQVVDLSRGKPWPRWCVDGKMNVIHNCLDKWAEGGRADETALVWEGEEGLARALTYRQLQRLVNQTANAMKSLGIKKGDAVGLFMPMTPEIVAAMLATAKLGAVILPLFSGFGPGAISTRMKDADARLLFTADGFFRRGKPVLMKPIADEAANDIPTLEHMIVLNRIGAAVDMQRGRDLKWGDLIPPQSEQCPTLETNAEDVLMIIYTSGTTGLPKGAVHTHCGFPVKAAQDMAFGTDVHAGDTIYWVTDMGWMMGPWLVFGALLLGAAMVLYDGAPDYPAPDRIWELTARHRVNVLGISPTLVRALIPHGAEMARKHDLTALRRFASTGEPWNPAPWLWLFNEVGQGVRPIINYSGGTEISGGIVMGNPIQPLKPCAFSGPCPGMAADVFDEDGRPVRNQVGELVVKEPWIGMTRGFWKNPQRYLDAYWSRFPDVWVHGDFAAIDEDGLWYILGRSDDMIKVAGKRLGPAEVESVVVAHPDVIEAAAIAVPDEIKGNAVVVFCVSSRKLARYDDLRGELMQMLVKALGKPLMPKAILFVSDLPKTRNAKVMRRMIRSAYLDQDLGDTSSLVNPEAVEEIRNAQ